MACIAIATLAPPPLLPLVTCFDAVLSRQRDKEQHRRSSLTEVFSRDTSSLSRSPKRHRSSCAPPPPSLSAAASTTPRLLAGDRKSCLVHKTSWVRHGDAKLKTTDSSLAWHVSSLLIALPCPKHERQAYCPSLWRVSRVDAGRGRCLAQQQSIAPALALALALAPACVSGQGGPM